MVALRESVLKGLQLNRICLFEEMRKKPENKKLLKRNMEEAVDSLDEKVRSLDVNLRIMVELGDKQMTNSIYKYISEQVFMDARMYYGMVSIFSLLDVDNPEAITDFKDAIERLDPFVRRQLKIYDDFYNVILRDQPNGKAHLEAARYEATRNNFDSPLDFLEKETTRLKLSLKASYNLSRMMMQEMHPEYQLNDAITAAEIGRGICNTLFVFQRQIMGEEADKIFDLSYDFSDSEYGPIPK